jgi:hypothetical protein
MQAFESKFRNCIYPKKFPQLLIKYHDPINYQTATSLLPLLCLSRCSVFKVQTKFLDNRQCNANALHLISITRLSLF